jgi:tetratricopeptide (TPR) repeat protein
MASPSVSAPLRSAVSASELPLRAQDLLAGGDVAGYRRLFEQIAPIENPHRRYWAGVALIEVGLTFSAAGNSRRPPALLTGLAEAILTMLEYEPREPVLLQRAGRVLYELWSLDAAEEMFEAARRLDPRLDELERNLEAVAWRRRLLCGGRAPTILGAVPRDLELRACALAARAQPVDGLRLSLCMIVRDEAQTLPRCLAAVAGAVDEIVIVDTGSSDATVEIARSFGARILQRPWTGSFAEARNASLDAATGDWLLYLDADEVLVREDAPLLRSLTARTWREAFYLSETNYTGDLEGGGAVTHSALRIFRNRPEYRFRGRLHEQIADRLPGYLPERLESTGIRVEHYGYLGVVRDSREKSRRNIALLRLQQRESAPTPFLHYNLGSEYLAAGEPALALGELERSWALLAALPDSDSYTFAPALASRLVKALRACGRQRDAIARATESLRRFPDFTDLVLEQALAAAELGEQERARRLCERCLEMGDAPSRYTASVGAGSYLPMVQLAALERARGELAASIALLERCLREHPRFVGSVMPYAAALLAHGLAPDIVVERVERYVPDATPAARFMLATALYEGGATLAAEGQFRAVLARQPASSRARVALGEALLAQRRYHEAATVAAGLPVEDPLAIMACRTQLFATIAGGESAQSSGALTRAQECGMAAAELELFTGWEQLANDGRTAVTLLGEAVEPLAVMLEALLRVHDFETFETLLGLLHRTPLHEREQRELLAAMYLRRGFLTSAAEEWMAICRQRPDARALVGLARVALARGMHQEASEFAEAALTYEPGNEAAASLLSQSQLRVAAA